jgi:hypothetical protein
LSIILLVSMGACFGRSIAVRIAPQFQVEVFALALNGLTQGAPGASWLDKPEYSRFVRILTNYPPIENLVFEAHFAGSEPRVYQFRYQREGFFARELISDDAGALDSTTKRAAGRWLDEYWSYDGEYRMLENYWLDPTYTDSLALWEVRRFEEQFSFFCNWGISSDGINSLAVEGKSLASRSPAHHERDWVTLVNESDVILSNGIPVRITAVTIANGGRRHLSTISFSHDRDFLTHPYPFELLLYDGPIEQGILSGRMKVREIALGDSATPLGREMFVPALSAWGTNIRHSVVTNRSRFLVHSGTGHLFPIPVEDSRRRRHYVLFLLGAALLPLAAWVVVRHFHNR